MTRRGFVRATAFASTGLFLGARSVLASADRSESRRTALSLFVNLDQEGQFHIFYKKTDMGQGVATLAAMIAAEELEVSLNRITIHTPLPGPDYPNMMTGGSYSARSAFGPLRRHFAAIRALLVQAAGGVLQIPDADLYADDGLIVHRPTGRRLNYVELIPHAAKLELPENAPPKPASAFRLLGKPTKQIRNHDIVRGALTYGMDIHVPGMVHAAMVRAPVVGASIRQLSATQSEKVAGYLGFERIAGNDVATFPEHIRNSVAVLATDTFAAQRAAAALQVDWDLGTNAEFESAGYMGELEKLSKQPGKVIRDSGDAAGAIAASSKVVEATYSGPFLAHAPMEPVNAVAHCTANGCEVWTSNHAQNRLLDGIQELTGLPEAAIKIHTPAVGGSFGRRLQVDYALEAVLVSRAIGKPVKIVWTREEDIREGVLRTPYVQTMRGAVSDEKVEAFEQTIACSSVWQLREPRMLVDGIDDTVAMPATMLPYAIDNVRMSQNTVALPYPIGWWRASYPTIHHTVQECFVDELIHAAGGDPLDMRIAMLADGSKVTFSWRNGWGDDVADRSRLLGVLKKLREVSGWGNVRGVGEGQGVAISVYADTHIGQVVSLSVVNGQVRIKRVHCVVDCGFAINPDGVRAQIESGVIFGLSAALFGQITFTKGRVDQGNFSDYRIMRLSETPAIDVHIIPRDADSDVPVSGVGEPGAHPIMAATCNAVFAATGRRIRQLPIGNQLAPS